MLLSDEYWFFTLCVDLLQRRVQMVYDFSEKSRFSLPLTQAAQRERLRSIPMELKSGLPRLKLHWLQLLVLSLFWPITLLPFHILAVVRQAVVPKIS